MDDLISRKAAIETISYHEDIDNEAYKIVKRILTLQEAIPAVPLDKLCEWLERNAAGRWNGLEYTAAGWKDELTRWMEGFDAAG